MAIANPATPTCGVADVVDLVGDLIAKDHLGPGERLPPIRELAVRFGVKAGTVRDALLDAQGKGLVKVLPRVGAIVQPASDSQSSKGIATHLIGEFGELMRQQDQNLFHVLDTREALELNMIARASQRRELPELFNLRQILEEMAAIPVESDRVASESTRAETAEYVDLDIQFHLEIARLSGNSVMASLLEILMQELKPHLARIRWSDNRREETNDSHARIYSALVAGDVEEAQREMKDHIRTAFDSLLAELRDPPTMNGNG